MLFFFKFDIISLFTPLQPTIHWPEFFYPQTFSQLRCFFTKQWFTDGLLSTSGLYKSTQQCVLYIFSLARSLAFSVWIAIVLPVLHQLVFLFQHP